MAHNNRGNGFGRTWILGVLLAAVPAAVPEKAPADNRPNIIFVFTDDHAQHALSAYGSVINQTPQLDRLAAEGMLFREVFVANSICAPSRATLLTGKHSHLNGQLTNRDRFDGTQPTFPKLLQESGYTTAMIGKWHLRSDPTGFDHWDILPGQGSYYNPERFIYEPSLRTPLIVRWPGVTGGGENTDMVSNLDWAPTMLEMAGVEVPGDMQGRSRHIISER